MTVEDFNKNDMACFDHIKLKAIGIGLTDESLSCVIFKGIDETLTITLYKTRMVYDALLLYIYKNQDAQLFWNRAFSTPDRLLLEEKGIMPSSLKEVVSEKLLLTQSDIRFLNRDVPPEWKIIAIVDKTRGTSLNSILLMDFRIQNLDISAIVRHKEDHYYLVVPLYYLQNVYKVNTTL
jgi:hypothetical protein